MDLEYFPSVPAGGTAKPRDLWGLEFPEWLSQQGVGRPPVAADLLGSPTDNSPLDIDDVTLLIWQKALS